MNLNEYVQYLDAFRAAKDGNKKGQLVLARYNSMIAVKREKAQMSRLILKELVSCSDRHRSSPDLGLLKEWQERLRNRPILTGAYLRPSLLNGPLPRMKPQPVGVSMMIRNRRLARERRLEKAERIRNLKQDMTKEAEFEQALDKLASVEPVFQDEEWGE